jgi:hypothetical protein
MKRKSCNNSRWKAANQSKDWRIRRIIPNRTPRIWGKKLQRCVLKYCVCWRDLQLYFQVLFAIRLKNYIFFHSFSSTLGSLTRYSALRQTVLIVCTFSWQCVWPRPTNWHIHHVWNVNMTES